MGGNVRMSKRMGRRKSWTRKSKNWRTELSSMRMCSRPDVTPCRAVRNRKIPGKSFRKMKQHPEAGKTSFHWRAYLVYQTSVRTKVSSFKMHCSKGMPKQNRMSKDTVCIRDLDTINLIWRFDFRLKLIFTVGPAWQFDPHHHAF